MNLAENIRNARLARGLTQSALAEALGVSDRAVSRWENSAAAPDVTLLSRLALTLQTSADALLGGYLTAALEKLAAEDTAYCHAASAIRDILAALP